MTKSTTVAEFRNATMNAPIIHPFARFGAGPWQCIAVTEKKYQAAPGAPIQAGGTCDVCGTCIMYAYTFRCATGETFVTGCDCAQKAGRDYGKQCRTAMRAWRSEVRSRTTAAQREEREQARRAAEQWTLAKMRVDHPEWFIAVDALAAADAFSVSIAADFGDRLSRGTELTTAQAALLAKLYRAHVRPASKHYGTVGARVKALRVTFEGCAVYDGHFGVVRIYTLATAAGELLVWKTGGFLASAKDCYDRPEVGAELTIDATVKAHGEYKGQLQTEIARAKQVWA